MEEKEKITMTLTWGYINGKPITETRQVPLENVLKKVFVPSVEETRTQIGHFLEEAGNIVRAQEEEEKKEDLAFSRKCKIAQSNKLLLNDKKDEINICFKCKKQIDMDAIDEYNKCSECGNIFCNDCDNKYFIIIKCDVCGATFCTYCYEKENGSYCLECEAHL